MLDIAFFVVFVVVVALLIAKDIRWIRSCDEPPCTPSRRQPLTGYPHTEYLSKRLAWKGLQHKDKIQTPVKKTKDIDV